MTRDLASIRQVEAADPGTSTWLSANAGSGKTRVLTDRVARLLLNGVEPQRILCLTYTKAAASEMQNRLFRRLGEWAMQDADALRASLAGLGAEGPADEGVLASARRLFARAIETPGGLRIQTIHSFCASLLRRFPLEAGVSPQFVELDDRAARLIRNEIVEEMAESLAPEAVAAIARHFTGDSLDDLAENVARNRSHFPGCFDRAAALRQFGLPEDAKLETVLASVLLGGEEAWLPKVVDILAGGGTNDSKAAARLSAFSFAEPDLEILEDVFLTGASAQQPYSAKIGSFPTKATRAALGPLLAPLEALMLRVEAARADRIALRAAERTLALHRLADAFLPEYAARKAAGGKLDFDDLIAKARQLLTDPSVAQWVLFRLDGGIDHILVDEAQDTSPEQWRVIELLAQEFTTGRGARDVERTIFVVGDKKQSIYSFQGADLQAFDRMKAEFRARLAQVDMRLADLTLDHSFRSSRAILDLVDRTFDPETGRALGTEVRHIAFHEDLPGRVDLWPAIAKVEDPEPGDWFDPVDLVTDEHHNARLARRIADQITGWLADGVQIPLSNGRCRPMTAGDVLILVQRRSGLFGEIIRACKAAGLPIAGADRLKLGGEIAVRDLTALLSFLATDDDELSLAAVLRSPLFGWSEQDLFSLAQGRKGGLWEALRGAADRRAETVAVLRDLRDQSDFLRPYDLIERALTRHDGRRRLIARLGEEAEDGIDELLTQALAYERSEVPSLTGFLGWLTTEEIEVKRQMESAGGRIRVMTVHGAKGLEAPVVILPETQDRRAPSGDDIVPIAQGGAAWRMRAEDSPPPLAAAQSQRQAAAAQESLRLLYVAMTRAQCWLIVAAAGSVENPDCWYQIVAQGMISAGAEPLSDGMLRLACGNWPLPSPGAEEAAGVEPALPDWARRPAPEGVRPPAILSPSDLGGAKALAGDSDPSLQELAKRRGTSLHLLLELLPGLPPAAWPSAADRLLADIDPQDRALELDRATSVLTHPAFGALFGSGSLAEVEVAGRVGGQMMAGSIDRLIIAPDRVTAIDFKSNRVVPDRAEDVPEGILRQMAAYGALLEQLHPNKQVDLAILWTEGPSLMPLPRDLVMAALQRITVP
ncbi:double-strand break repair helicase AddA [Tabrizicola sp. J26]|uniref:double-strand break repair helicase AddA n=1 Tax=Alitabrizicola rongguiensis TaxID=2909234 RepID=UPI001F1C102A|nr:double-strand break repair helicase AddA [Tabrizicola rongguiensis]MCF1708227.1 double-strand break repair helicase AddA [Tabrizicola rongguiensis]